MSTFLKLTGTTALAIGMQLVAFGTAFASVEPAFSGESSGAATQPKLSLSVDANSPSKTGSYLKNDSTYNPPADINGPGRTQGSGTR